MFVVYYISIHPQTRTIVHRNMSSTGEGSGSRGQGGGGGGSGGGSGGGRQKKKPDKPISVILEENDNINTAMVEIILGHGGRYGLHFEDFEKKKDILAWINFIQRFQSGSDRPLGRVVTDDQNQNLTELVQDLRTHLYSKVAAIRKSKEETAAHTLLDMRDSNKTPLQRDVQSKREALQKFHDTQSKFLSVKPEMHRPRKEVSIHVETAAQSIIESLKRDFTRQAIVSIIERLVEINEDESQGIVLLPPDEHPFRTLKRPRPDDGDRGGGGCGGAAACGGR